MLDKKNIILTMIGQHRILQKDLNLAMETFTEDTKNKILIIDAALRKFKGDLIEHLNLENGILYTELMREMKEKGEDTTNTENFINEMKKIGDAVIEFLEKYSDEEKIGEHIKELPGELKDIISVLDIRIESEELGVYSYWS